MEKIKVDLSMLNSDEEFLKRKPGTLHISYFYIPFDFLPYIAADEISMKKLLNFQKELYKGIDKSNDNWIYQIEMDILEKIKWVIV